MPFGGPLNVAVSLQLGAVVSVGWPLRIEKM
jgi:hypothetical protein